MSSLAVRERPLLRPNRLDRIDPKRPQGRQQRPRECHQKREPGHGGECRHVGRRHADEQRLQRASGDVGQREPRHQAGRRPAARPASGPCRECRAAVRRARCARRSPASAARRRTRARRGCRSRPAGRRRARIPPRTRTWTVRDAVWASTMSVIVCTSEIGCCGSTPWTIERTAGIELVERRRRTDDQILRHVEDERVVRLLLVRQVDLRLAGALETPDADVGDDADDRAIAVGELERPPDGILPRPVALDERLAHHRDHLRLRRVGIGSRRARSGSGRPGSRRTRA